MAAAAFGEDEHADGFARAMRQRAGAAHHLVGLLGIDAEAEGKRDRLVELRGGERLENRDRLGERIGFLGVHLFGGGAITFASFVGMIGAVQTSLMALLRLGLISASGWNAGREK